MKNLLIVGPWIGEFSYEISWWIPQIREIIKTKYSSHHIISISHQGRRKLYDDFSDTFLEIPKELVETIKYPSSFGSHVGGVDIIPNIFHDYINKIKSHYSDQQYVVDTIIPNSSMFGWGIVKSENPPGDFINYSPDSDINEQVKKEIYSYFGYGRDCISIMARIKNRGGRKDKENWSQENWEKFIEYCILYLKLNVVLIDIPNRDSCGGSIDFTQTNLYKTHHQSIQIIKVEGENSINKQLAILKNTKCSVYGASGAVTLAFLANTPTFTQQTKENGMRLRYKWQKNLTNNHKNVRIYDTYPMSTIYSSPVEEFFNEFKTFYKTIQT